MSTKMKPNNPQVNLILETKSTKMKPSNPQVNLILETHEYENETK